MKGKAKIVKFSSYHKMSRNITEQNRSPIFRYVRGANNVVEDYGKKIKSCMADGLERPCPVRSALKRMPLQDFGSFFILFYYLISTTNQKIGDLFCPVHISGLSQSVKDKLN
jgi:hypothetical protein